MPNVLGPRGILFVISVMAILPGMAQAGAICPLPSDGSVTCLGGTYTFSSVTTAGVQLDLANDGSWTELGDSISPIQFVGTTTVNLTAVNSSTSIPSELYNLYETNTAYPAGASTPSIPAGALTLIAGAGSGISSLYSPGSISYESGQWNSVFDVFFELTIPDPAYSSGFLVVTNYDAMDPGASVPLVVTSYGLTEVPPQSAAYCIYASNGVCAADSTFTPIPLYDLSGVQQGVLDDTPLDPNGIPGIPDYAHHYVFTPEPGTLLLLGSALLGVTLQRRRRA